MLSLGSYLRGLREKRGVSVGEIARLTRVPHRCVEALEADDFARLPPPVFTRGFIRAYCQVLGEPVDDALARYADRDGTVDVEDRPGRAGFAGPRRRSDKRGAVFISFLLVVVLGLALFAMKLALQSGRYDLSGDPRGSGVSASGPPIDRVNTPRGSGTAEEKTGQGSPLGHTSADVESGGSSATIAPGSVYRLVARTTEATWMRVKTDEGRASEETIPPGQVREWVSDRPFVLTVGNAGGVTLELNGRTLPSLGERGAVIRQLVVPSTPE